MGRWAQQHRRGGHHPGAPDFSIAQPAPDDWSLVASGTEGFADLTVLSTLLGADGFLVRYGVGGPPVTLSPDNPYAELATLSLPIEGPAGGLDISAQIAWSLGAAQVSDWSAIKTIPTT